MDASSHAEAEDRCLELLAFALGEAFGSFERRRDREPERWRFDLSKGAGLDIVPGRYNGSLNVHVACLLGRATGDEFDIFRSLLRLNAREGSPKYVRGRRLHVAMVRQFACDSAVAQVVSEQIVAGVRDALAQFEHGFAPSWDHGETPAEEDSPDWTDNSLDNYGRGLAITLRNLDRPELTVDELDTPRRMSVRLGSASAELRIVGTTPAPTVHLRSLVADDVPFDVRLARSLASVENNMTDPVVLGMTDDSTVVAVDQRFATVPLLKSQQLSYWVLDALAMVDRRRGEIRGL